MAKKLAFTFQDSPVNCEMNKVDRSRLYGFKELEVVDDEGKPCELATLAGDGKTLVGKGGTGIGYLTAEGNWADKSKLTPVDLEGEPMTAVPSSFAAPIAIEQEVGVNEFLNHNIRLIYQLGVEGAMPDELFAKLKKGAIFQFDYSYRGGLEADHGFLLLNESDELFFLVGDPTNVEFLGLQQAAPLVESDDGVSESAADELMDFGMI